MRLTVVEVRPLAAGLGLDGFEGGSQPSGVVSEDHLVSTKELDFTLQQEPLRLQVADPVLDLGQR